MSFWTLKWFCQLVISTFYSILSCFFVMVAHIAQSLKVRTLVFFFSICSKNTMNMKILLQYCTVPWLQCSANLHIYYQDIKATFFLHWWDFTGENGLKGYFTLIWRSCIAILGVTYYTRKIFAANLLLKQWYLIIW